MAKKYDLIDFETGVKITGAGFPLYKGLGARLQRALINFFLDENIKAGYQEMMPPLMVNADSGYGTGQLPDKDGQMYYVNEEYFFANSQCGTSFSCFSGILSTILTISLSASDFPRGTE